MRSGWLSVFFQGFLRFPRVLHSVFSEEQGVCLFLAFCLGLVSWCLGLCHSVDDVLLKPWSPESPCLILALLSLDEQTSVTISLQDAKLLIYKNLLFLGFFQLLAAESSESPSP